MLELGLEGHEKLVECGVASYSFLSSWASVYANVRRKLVVGEGDERVREFVGREMNLDGMAFKPARKMDMASSRFPTLFVHV